MIFDNTRPCGRPAGTGATPVQARAPTRIEQHAGRDVSELSVGFSTTNYHVFRGYVCAHQAGMSVEGMGARTKWYFWPNAFLREFVGLLVRRWQDVLTFFLIVSGFYLFVLHVLSLAGA